jgi:NAD(P)-dependent dehydrogenase (short-subunit alcohol dehydrogenase family)
LKTAIVTGCLGAIGRATCVELRTAGFDLVGIDKPANADFAGSYHACDLADASAVSRVLAAIETEFHAVDLLVNNAAHYQPISWFDLTLDDFDLVYAINVRAVFQLSQEVARWMVAQELAGSIVNIASIAGKLGSPIIPYGTSKAAIIGLTRSMAKVLGPHGIRVNAIAPGVIATPMSAAVDEAQMRKQLANVSMERMGDPQEIAKVVAFLATADAGYMSGSIVDVNGGWMA